MQVRKEILTLAGVAFIALPAESGIFADFPMDLVSGNSVVEKISGKSFSVVSQTKPESVPGAKGKALRFDGYSTYVKADVPVTTIGSQLTFSLWCAVETYPMMNVAEAQNAYADIAGNLDEKAKSGFAFQLSSQGDLRFKCFMNGWEVVCDSPVKLQKYCWNNLVAVVNGDEKKISIYNNGELLATTKALSTINAGDSEFTIGMPKIGLYSGEFLINTFNGIIDEICVSDVALSQSEVKKEKAENVADLSIPESRFAGNLLRPTFHGMPAACWTNEPHGLAYFGGKYHVFFQKNANGPYMARLHWGHISSENLYKWTEEKIAIAPSENYDIKGCWSGCVYTDDILTGGVPNIFYTSVDNARATISHAVPVANDLVEWVKDESNPVIDGRPSGLSDDFRDCYIFSNNGNYYMIVGTSKNGCGATTLHRYNIADKTWSNDGSIFFQADNASVAGRFWEMANVTKLADGKWLFTATPLDTSVGVETLYWIGNINSDGTFTPLPEYASKPGKLELDGFSSYGYGLLSPSVMQVDGKTVALGIVPDKLPGRENFKLGWAHNYSLPREWYLTAEGTLGQKPFSGLEGMRSAISFSRNSFDLSGDLNLSPVSGRKVEVIGEFVIGESSEFGFDFFGDGSVSAKLKYSVAENSLIFDFSQLPRLVNDGGSFNGVYRSALPKTFKKGDVLKMHVFIDHSIADIFINDTWAASVRLFPTGEKANGVSAFSTGVTNVKAINAWVLDENLSSVWAPLIDQKNKSEVFYNRGILEYRNVPQNSELTVYTVYGGFVCKHSLAQPSGTVETKLDHGVYLAVVEGDREREVFKICAN